MEQTVLHLCLTHIDAIGQNKGPLELSRRNPAMQEYTVIAIVRLSAANDQLAILDGNRQIILGKTCNGQCDPIAVV